jgi:protease-4
MTTKRWIAIIVASALLVVSIGINTLSYIFSKDVAGIFEELAETSSTGYGQLIIEEGGNDQIAVLSLDGVIQDTGGASPFFFEGYNDQFC